jgi:hypothetical protein
MAKPPEGSRVGKGGVTAHLVAVCVVGCGSCCGFVDIVLNPFCRIDHLSVLILVSGGHVINECSPQLTNQGPLNIQHAAQGIVKLGSALFLRKIMFGTSRLCCHF